jgi:hypothetical protein
METLLSFIKSIHKLKVPSFFFTNRTWAPRGDILGCIYPFFKNSLSYICNCFNFGVPILYGVLDIGEDPGTKSKEKSMSLFGGNHVTSLKTSSKSFKTEWSSMLYTLSLVVSSIWDENT